MAGKYIKQWHYESFESSLLHRAWQLDDLKVIELLSKADRQLGRLDMYSEYIPDIDLFLSMHVTKEAIQSLIPMDLVLNKETQTLQAKR